MTPVDAGSVNASTVNASTAGSRANLVITDWPYRDSGTPLTGALVRDESVPGARPGILLIHGGAGLDEHAREQACRYAALGYVVLACDMLGDGVAGDRDRVIGCLTALRDDPALMARRARAGLAALARCPDVEGYGLDGHRMADGRVAAVGFCFGGLAALTLARSGEPLAGVVSIHGSLATSQPAPPGAVRARVLACHGAADPHVPPGDVTAFAREMDAAGADWQLIMYGGAVHGFTHARATPGAIPGVAYDPRADRRSFAAASGFLAEVLA
jgi:dienelactone hydrolase